MNPNISQLFAALHNEPNIWFFQNIPGRTSAINVTLPNPQGATADNVHQSGSLDDDNSVLYFDPDLEVITITGDSDSWTEERSELIKNNLPMSLKIYNRTVYDTSRRSEAHITTLFSENSQDTISGLSLPFNTLSIDIASSALFLPNLAELFLSAPLLPLSPNNAVSPTDTINFLSSFTSLRLVSLTISPSTPLLLTLMALQTHHSTLSHLALKLSPHFHPTIDFSPADKATMDNELLRGLETFIQLEHLIIENTLVEGNEALHNALKGLPRLAHLDVQTPEFMKSEINISRFLRATLPV